MFTKNNQHMKQMQFLYAMVIVAMGMSSCSYFKEDKAIHLVPGIYVKDINQEFARGKDTIEVKTLDQTVGSYTIIRRTKYQQQIDGKHFKPRYEIEREVAIYNPATNQLLEQNKGKVYTFSEGNAVVLTGGSEYKKVK
ncbi:hypothetical protein BH11BAC5_BH11BAC5_24000 [soil metagenome]